MGYGRLVIPNHLHLCCARGPHLELAAQTAGGIFHAVLGGGHAVYEHTLHRAVIWNSDIQGVGIAGAVASEGHGDLHVRGVGGGDGNGAAANPPIVDLFGVGVPHVRFAQSVADVMFKGVQIGVDPQAGIVDVVVDVDHAAQVVGQVHSFLDITDVIRQGHIADVRKNQIAPGFAGQGVIPAHRDFQDGPMGSQTVFGGGVYLEGEIGVGAVTHIARGDQAVVYHSLLGGVAETHHAGGDVDFRAGPQGCFQRIEGLMDVIIPCGVTAAVEGVFIHGVGTDLGPICQNGAEVRPIGTADSLVGAQQIFALYTVLFFNLRGGQAEEVVVAGLEGGVVGIGPAAETHQGGMIGFEGLFHSLAEEAVFKIIHHVARIPGQRGELGMVNELAAAVGRHTESGVAVGRQQHRGGGGLDKLRPMLAMGIAVVAVGLGQEPVAHIRFGHVADNGVAVDLLDAADQAGVTGDEAHFRGESEGALGEEQRGSVDQRIAVLVVGLKTIQADPVGGVVTGVDLILPTGVIGGDANAARRCGGEGGLLIIARNVLSGVGCHRRPVGAIGGERNLIIADAVGPGRNVAGLPQANFADGLFRGQLPPDAGGESVVNGVQPHIIGVVVNGEGGRKAGGEEVICVRVDGVPGIFAGVGAGPAQLTGFVARPGCGAGVSVAARLDIRTNLLRLQVGDAGGSQADEDGISGGAAVQQGAGFDIGIREDGVGCTVRLEGFHQKAVDMPILPIVMRPAQCGPVGGGVFRNVDGHQRHGVPTASADGFRGRLNEGRGLRRNGGGGGPQEGGHKNDQNGKLTDDRQQGAFTVFADRLS